MMQDPHHSTHDSPWKAHWERAYRSKAAEAQSWFQRGAPVSMRLIRAAGLPPGSAAVDAGGGASPLPGELLAAGFGDVTVIDVSGAAIAAGRERLGNDANRVRWIEGDVLAADPGAGRIDLWHDRALFHFLIAADDRRAYVERMARALRPGGWAVIATFADDGPAKCSGLPTLRFSPAGLAAEVGGRFTLVASEREEHRTPAGMEQRFMYCLFRFQP